MSDVKKPLSPDRATLADPQKEIIRELWDKLDILRLTHKVFNDPSLGNHAPEIDVVRAYIATLVPDESEKKSKSKPLKGSVKLTDAQIVNITAMLNQDEPPTVREITMMMFPDLPDLTPVHGEYRAVFNLVQSINEDAVSVWDEPVETRRYKPPVSYSSMIGAINRYVGNPYDPSKALYDPSNMKSLHERNVKALFSYTKSTRFILSATQYDSKADRELFESTFVNLVHDKAAELIPEDVAMYISAAAEAVQISQIERAVQKHERYINEIIDGTGDKEGRQGKLTTAMSDSANSLREKLDKSKGRFKGLLESVAESRGKRKDSKAGANESLINWLALWTEEEDRERLLEFARQEHEEDGKEYERLRDLDDVIALVAGQSEHEARGGP